MLMKSMTNKIINNKMINKILSKGGEILGQQKYKD